MEHGREHDNGKDIFGYGIKFGYNIGGIRCCGVDMVAGVGQEMKLEPPKDVEENIRWRYKLIDGGRRDERIAAAGREIFRRDVLFAFNAYFWTHDTRTEGKDLPFVTWSYQDEAITRLNEGIEKGEDVFIEKSRDMGVTYIVLYVLLWRWLTKRGELYRIGSRKEEYVDTPGNMDTHFEKMRYAIKKLPDYLRPEGFEWRKHSSFMRMINPEHGSSLIGEATNADFGRGGRNKAIFFDEFPAWEMANEAWRSASDATPCKIVVGTPKGSGNKFAELSRTDEIKNKMKLLWYKHPRKVGYGVFHEGEVKKGKIYDKVGQYVVEKRAEAEVGGCYVDQHGKIRSEWYDRQHDTRDRDDIAENVDCSYLTSGNPVFDLLKCDKMLRSCKAPEQIGNLVWKVRPVFDSYGACINRAQLTVDLIENTSGLYKIWEQPQAGWINGYAVSADVAEGLKQGDYDAACVIKRFGDEPEIVASIQCKLKTFEYAEELVKLAVWYGRAILAIERTGMGLVVIDGVMPLYMNLYHKAIFTKGYADRTDQIGWSTSSQSKQIIVGNLQSLISNEEFTDNDEGFWKECMTFVNDNGELEAQGKHRGEACYDDRVMSRAIGLWIHTQLPLPRRAPGQDLTPSWKKRRLEKFDENCLVRFAVRESA